MGKSVAKKYSKAKSLREKRKQVRAFYLIQGMLMTKEELLNYRSSTQ